MKINPRNNVYLRTLVEGAATKKEKVAAKPTSVGDSIIISDTARLLKECLNIGEPYAGDRVSAIREALQRGDYPLDVSRLAYNLARAIGDSGRGEQ